ncbi:hypothetical protein [Flavobacterium faecale]|uniref:hypothetical protein n=1 Tax=Flavobacterium faecale TaxID=1355330 RepID=UPI003AADDC24
MEKNIDLFRNVLLSAQRAILGEIYVEIRAIAIGFDSKKLTIICYLDRMPIEDDYENLSNIAGQILADIDFETVEERCVFSNDLFSKLDSLDSFIYARKEHPVSS